jgi:hypothetical protein
MVKFRKAGENAAYEIAEGVYTPEEAARLNLAVVETDPTSGAPTAYGRYLHHPKDGPLGVTSPVSPDTEVRPGGTVSPAAAAGPGPSKGDIVNPNDPVIHGGSDEIHADNAPPPVEDLEAERRAATEAAEQSVEDASKSTKRK